PCERPPPGTDEVEIAVEAAGANFLDVLTALGEIPSTFGIRELGLELCGRITRLGSGVRNLREGQRVLAVVPGGAFATHVIASATLTAAVPDALDAAQAATLPIAHLTSYYALHHVARLERGERVLIHSAAGGVGLAALQWARQRGAQIFATAGSAEKR